MRVKVDVETKTFVRLVLIAMALIGIIFLAWKLWPALMLVAVSFFLALALNPPVNAIAQKLPGHSRVMATALAYVLVLSVLGVFIYVALPPAVSETTKFVDSLPGAVQKLSAQRGLVADLVNQYNLHDQLSQLVSGAQQQAAGLAQGIGSSLVNGISSILGGFITLITVLVLTFLMLIEGPRWIERLWNLYTDDAKLARHQRLAEKMYKVVSGYVNGQALVAVIAAAAGLVTLLMLTYFFPMVPVSAVVPLAGVIFVTSLIPMIGALIGATIVAAVLLFSDVGAALAFVVYFFIYQQIENNFIVPLVQARTIALSALGIFVAVILGISLLGLVGGIVAIPVAGCLRVILLDYMEHRTHKAKPKRGGLLAKITSS